jgi:hypothetical protein
MLHVIAILFGAAFTVGVAAALGFLHLNRLRVWVQVSWDWTWGLAQK